MGGPSSQEVFASCPASSQLTKGCCRSYNKGLHTWLLEPMPGRVHKGLHRWTHQWPDLHTFGGQPEQTTRTSDIEPYTRWQVHHVPQRGWHIGLYPFTGLHRWRHTLTRTQGQAAYIGSIGSGSTLCATNGGQVTHHRWKGVVGHTTRGSTQGCLGHIARGCTNRGSHASLLAYDRAAPSEVAHTNEHIG